MSITEINTKLDELLKTDDIASIKGEVRGLLANFKAEIAKIRQTEQEAWKEQEHEEGEEFEFTAPDESKQFDELMTSYRERVKEHGKKIAEEQSVNLKAKKDVLNELKSMVSDEENIGKMFSVFNELKEKWDAIGNVPGDKYREIIDEYQQLREHFFYNVNIYKELQENDLRINLKKKEVLIEKATNAIQVADLKEMEVLLRSYQKEWMNVGPSPRETYQEVGDTFFNTCREGFKKIQAHYDSLRVEQNENLEKKKALVEEVRKVVEIEITNHGTWAKKTEEIIALQAKWKEIGFAPKKENEEVWHEFRGLCDLFFEKKKSFYEVRNAEQKIAKEKKLALIAKADQLKDSTDWKSATNTLIQLQKDWKEVGAASQKDEQTLWGNFRAACDHFFNAKKQHFSGQDEEQKENLRMKQDLIEQIKAYELVGNQHEDLTALRQFSAAWKDIGFVPRKSMDSSWESFKTALDEKYSSMKTKQSERSIEAYKTRVESLASSGDERDVKREKYLLRDKIDRLKQRVIQYENNMEIFTGKGANAMRQEISKKIDNANREIKEIREKLKMLSNN